jgi:hypothetical protein
MPKTNLNPQASKTHKSKVPALRPRIRGLLPHLHFQDETSTKIHTKYKPESTSIINHEKLKAQPKGFPIQAFSLSRLIVNQKHAKDQLESTIFKIPKKLKSHP